MFAFLKRLFSKDPDTNYSELIENGAQIVDVRTRAEFKNGHIEGSVNIPLDELDRSLSKIRKDRAVIVCCASSGMRSESATELLVAKGFTHVYNAGAWMKLKGKLEHA